jgi:PAS domain S-box-containing protein
MSWIDFAWPMMGAASLTLALIHLVVWARDRSQTDHLMFAVICLSVSAVSVFELELMRAQTADHYAALMRWLHVPTVLIFIGMVGFVRLHFRVGNLWLGMAAIAARCTTLIADFGTGVSLNFQEITSLLQVPVWGSSAGTITVPIGVPNPWMLLGTFSIVLMIVFLADAIVQARRRDPPAESRRVLVVCGNMIAFGVLAGGWALAVVHGWIRAPFVVIPGFLGVVFVMSHDLGGAILRAAQLSRNLTLSETNLRDSEQRMDLAVRAAGIGIWTWDIAGNEGWHSPMALRMLGFAPDEPFDRPRFLERVNPADRHAMEAAYTAAMQGNGDFRSEYRLAHPDGRTRWIAARGQVEFDSARNPLRLGGVVLDITERRQAEEHFRLAVEAAPTAMLMVGSDGRIALANHQAEAVFGYSRAELITMHVDALVPPRHRDVHAAHRAGYATNAIMRAMGAGRELFGQRKDGSEIAVEIALNPIRVDAELFVLASITDISERKRIERESAMQRDELAHLSRIALVSELSGSMAHELNQPLTAILSNAQAALRFLARQPPALDDVLECLTNVVENDKRAGEIIRRLRAMLRKDSAEHAELDMNDVVKDVLRLMRNDLLHRNVEVAVELAPDLPPVDGDRVQLQQVLMNLIVNGCDAMENVARRPRLTVRTQAGNPHGIVVSVSDIGRGIPADQLDSIFSPFVSTKPSGMGLGLTVCTTIINAHRGRLWATNNDPAKGATLHFSVPAAGAAPAS